MVIPEVDAKLDELFEGGLESVVLFGIEAHVCILQTALDLLQKGIDVHIVADATSSRSQSDRLIAFSRLRQAGVVVSTCESTLFQLLCDKNHDKFKDIQALIKERAPDTGLVFGNL